MRNREDQVMVLAGQQTRSLPLQAVLGGPRLTLRTAALMTGVVERALDVTRGATPYVPAERRRAAACDPVRGAVNVRGQAVALRVRYKVLLENPSERAFHSAYNARCALACTPPA